jgi:hypothetical protein
MADATQAEVTIFHAINSADYLFTAGELGGYGRQLTSTRST